LAQILVPPQTTCLRNHLRLVIFTKFPMIERDQQI
jgi:hypothetical protein